LDGAKKARNGEARNAGPQKQSATASSGRKSRGTAPGKDGRGGERERSGFKLIKSGTHGPRLRKCFCGTGEPRGEKAGRLRKKGVRNAGASMASRMGKLTASVAIRDRRPLDGVLANRGTGKRRRVSEQTCRVGEKKSLDKRTPRGISSLLSASNGNRKTKDDEVECAVAESNTRNTTWTVLKPNQKFARKKHEKGDIDKR